MRSKKKKPKDPERDPPLTNDLDELELKQKIKERLEIREQRSYVSI